MKTKKKLNRKRLMRFPSVVPVTSRETTGTTHRKTNLLTAAKQQLRYAQTSLNRKAVEIKRLTAVINFLKKGD